MSTVSIIATESLMGIIEWWRRKQEWYVWRPRSWDEVRGRAGPPPEGYASVMFISADGECHDRQVMLPLPLRVEVPPSWAAPGWDGFAVPGKSTRYELRELDGERKYVSVTAQPVDR